MKPPLIKPKTDTAKRKGASIRPQIRPKVIHNLPEGCRYERFMQATQDIRHDYIVEGLKTGEIFRKYFPLVAEGFTMGTLKTWISDCGLPAVRRELNKERGAIATKARAKLKGKIERGIEKKEGESLALAVKDEAVEREKQAQAKHTKRMSRQADKAFKVLKRIEPGDPTDEDDEGKMHVGAYIGLLKDYDGLARKIYNMDKATVVSPHQFQIAILTNQQGLTLAEDDSQVVEAELVEEAVGG